MKDCHGYGQQGGQSHDNYLSLGSPTQSGYQSGDEFPHHNLSFEHLPPRYLQGSYNKILYQGVPQAAPISPFASNPYYIPQNHGGYPQKHTSELSQFKRSQITAPINGFNDNLKDEGERRGTQVGSQLESPFAATTSSVCRRVRSGNREMSVPIEPVVVGSYRHICGYAPSHYSGTEDLEYLDRRKNSTISPFAIRQVDPTELDEPQPPQATRRITKFLSTPDFKLTRSSSQEKSMASESFVVVDARVVQNPELQNAEASVRNSQFEHEQTHKIESNQNDPRHPYQGHRPPPQKARVPFLPRSKCGPPQNHLKIIERLGRDAQQATLPIELDDSPSIEQLFRYGVSNSRVGPSFDVAKVLPERGVFSNDRSSTVSSKPTHKSVTDWAHGQRRYLTEVLRLSFTDSSESETEATLINHSVPMKQRISPPPKQLAALPPKKPVQHRAPKLSKPTKKTEKKTGPKREDDTNSEMARNRRAAEQIIQREIQAELESDEEFERGLFGEIIGRESILEQRRKAEAEGRRLSREIREKERLQQEEMKSAALAAAKRLEEEEMERYKRDKLEHDKRKQARLGIERREQAAIDESVKEMKREKAQKIIEASRRKNAEVAEARLQEMKKVEEVQVDPGELARLKAKQEQIKWVAASLKPATVSSKPPKNTQAGSEEDHTESDLFVRDTSDGGSIYDVDERSLARTTSAVNDEWDRRSTFKEERQKFRADQKLKEEQTRHEFLKKRLAERYPRGKSIRPGSQAKSPKSNFRHKTQPTEIKVGMKSPAIRKKLTTTAKEKLASAKSHRSSSLTPSIVSELEKISSSKKPVRTTALSRTSETSVAPVRVYSSQIKLVSDFEREKTEQALAEQKRNRAQEQKVARHKKEMEKARAKEVKRLNGEAADMKFTISQEEVNARADAYIAKREVYPHFVPYSTTSLNSLTFNLVQLWIYS
jgi:hypothetical protein